MSNKLLYFGSIAIVTIGLQGCTNPLGDSKSSIDPGYGPISKTPPAATGYEQISGAQVAKSSQSSSFITDATVGATTQNIRLTTTRNKIVYLSVQGQMISK